MSKWAAAPRETRGKFASHHSHGLSGSETSSAEAGSTPEEIRFLSLSSQFRHQTVSPLRHRPDPRLHGFVRDVLMEPKPFPVSDLVERRPLGPVAPSPKPRTHEITQPPVFNDIGSLIKPTSLLIASPPGRVRLEPGDTKSVSELFGFGSAPPHPWRIDRY